MIWIALFFVLVSLLEWLPFRKHGNGPDTVLRLSFLAVTVLFSGFVSWQRWSDSDPLYVLRVLFGPVSRWLYQIF
jgi:hypothetical protein